MKILRVALPTALLAAAALAIPAASPASTDTYHRCLTAYNADWHGYHIHTLSFEGKFSCSGAREIARYYIDHGAINEHWSCYTSTGTSGDTLVGCQRHGTNVNTTYAIRFHYRHV